MHLHGLGYKNIQITINVKDKRQIVSTIPTLIFYAKKEKDLPINLSQPLVFHLQFFSRSTAVISRFSFFNYSASSNGVGVCTGGNVAPAHASALNALLMMATRTCIQMLPDKFTGLFIISQPLTN
jgi:hypothetical protein